jgi:hypothetical protein
MALLVAILDADSLIGVLGLEGVAEDDFFFLFSLNFSIACASPRLWDLLTLCGWKIIFLRGVEQKNGDVGARARVGAGTGNNGRKDDNYTTQ